MRYTRQEIKDTKSEYELVPVSIQFENAGKQDVEADEWIMSYCSSFPSDEEFRNELVNLSVDEIEAQTQFKSDPERLARSSE